MTSFGRKDVNLKACKARGRKRVACVSAPHDDFHGEFDGLRKLGVKFNLVTLQNLVKDVLKANSRDAYSVNMVELRSGQPFYVKIEVS